MGWSVALTLGTNRVFRDSQVSMACCVWTVRRGMCCMQVAGLRLAALALGQRSVPALLESRLCVWAHRTIV